MYIRVKLKSILILYCWSGKIQTGENHVCQGLSKVFVFFTYSSGHEFLNFKNISFEMIFFWEDFSLSKEAYSPRQSPHKEVGQNPFMLAWVTNLSTSPDLNIEFIQVGFEQTPRLHHAFLKHDWHSNLKDKLPAKQ